MKKIISFLTALLGTNTDPDPGSGSHTNPKAGTHSETGTNSEAGTNPGARHCAFTVGGTCT